MKGGFDMEDLIKINIRIGDKLLEELDQEAENMNVSRSALIRIACLEYLKNHAKKPLKE